VSEQACHGRAPRLQSCRRYGARCAHVTDIRRSHGFLNALQSHRRGGNPAAGLILLQTGKVTVMP
jgi:hypothetical protein